MNLLNELKIAVETIRNLDLNETTSNDEAVSATVLADNYDLMRLEKEEVKKLKIVEIRAVIDYAKSYLSMYDSNMGSRLLWRPAGSVSYVYGEVEGKWMLCENGNIRATPQVPMADMDEIEACLKIKDLVKMLTAELVRR